jgi:pyruvate dehydrogenase E2 component (dihydrolipoamide acetyltransferase)
MATAITVPRRGWSMDEGTFAGWLKQDGEQVRRGDPLFVLETDKAAEEIESQGAGTLRLPPDAPRPGDTVKVGQVLAYLVAEGEAAPPSCGAQTAGAVTPGRQGPTTQERTQTAPTARRRQAISPRARRAAAELGVEWSRIQGSGRNGRIRERDVRAAAGRTEGRLIPHSGTRRTIAACMLAGITQAAPVTLTVRANAAEFVKARHHFKGAAGSGEAVPGYTDLLLKLVALTLRQHPLLQAQWRDDGLFVPDRIDIAVAVDTEAGLLAPVVRGVDRLTARQIAAQSRDLIDRARAGRLSAEEMRGATFTVSNLGGLGIDAFTPIIHLPQCAVLGLGRIVREPVVAEDRVVPGDVTTLSLTFDHRVVDGAPAARFLDVLRRRLERPVEEGVGTG